MSYQSVLSSIDKEILKNLEKTGKLENIFPDLIHDFDQYKNGFFSRVSKGIADAGAVLAESLGYELWSLNYRLTHLISTVVNPYVKNRDEAEFVINLQNSVCLLENSIGFLLADENGQVVDFRSEKRLQAPDEWDLRWVERFKKVIDNVISISGALIESMTASDSSPSTSQFISRVESTKAQVEEFREYLPTLLQIADENGALNLSVKEVKDDCEMWMSKALEAPNSFRVLKEFQGIVIGIVLQPGDPDNRDLHGHYMSAEEIEKSCYYFMESGHALGTQHNDFSDHWTLLEIWIQRDDTTIGGEFVKAGTWLMTTKAKSDEMKQKLQNGEINCYSPGGMAASRPDK